jgi:hypothetical protein
MHFHGVGELFRDCSGGYWVVGWSKQCPRVVCVGPPPARCDRESRWALHLFLSLAALPAAFLSVQDDYFTDRVPGGLWLTDWCCSTDPMALLALGDFLTTPRPIATLSGARQVLVWWTDHRHGADRGKQHGKGVNRGTGCSTAHNAWIVYCGCVPQQSLSKLPLLHSQD